MKQAIMDKMEMADSQKQLPDRPENASPLDMSLSEFSKKVLSDSLVTGVPNIVKARSRIIKIFKTVVLLTCACGFLYQATEFMRFILTYPSVVDIQFYIPDEYIRPAVTFCNNNGIKRSKFCAKYPSRCYTPEIEPFCKNYTKFCSSFKDLTNLTIVKPEYYDAEREISFQELKELGHDDIFASKHPEETSGPILVRKPDGVLVFCYSVFLRVDSPEEPQLIGKLLQLDTMIDEYQIDIEPHEVFRPYRAPGGILNVHSPFVFENTNVKGIIIKPNRYYMIYVRMEEEDLLPYPYPSDCWNYTDVWLKRNRNGPRSQEACQHRCAWSYMMKFCNCVLPETLYPTKVPYCDFPFPTCDRSYFGGSSDIELQKCQRSCKNECEKRTYNYIVRSRDNEVDPNQYNENPSASIMLYTLDPEVMKYKFRPQYQDLEIFSYIGGFIGAWLGVSLVAVIDFFEAVVRIGIFLFERKKGSLK